MNPANPTSPLEGIGRFNMENYLLYRCGLPLQTFTPAQVTACRWFTDALLPFLLLMILSYIPFRRPTAEDHLRTQFFFTKLRTPIGLTTQEDLDKLALARANPHYLDHQKIFPKSQWEFCKWSRGDILGFTGCWLLVLVILAFLKYVLSP